MNFSVRQNTITAYGVIWDGNGMEFVSLFTELEAQYEKVIVKMHSYGGSVFDGNLMYNTIERSKKNIDFIIVGIAASMAAVISLARKQNVYMVENGYMMIHAPSGSTYGTALDHTNNAKLLNAIEINFIKKLMDKTGKPESYVKKWLTGDNWFSAQEALKEGLITGIIEPETITTDTINPEQLGVKETYNRFSALLIPQNTELNLDTNMKRPIIEALGLTGLNEQSSDTAVIEAIKQHFEGKENTLKTELAEAKQKQKDAENKLADHTKTVISAAIETAKKEGRITADQVAIYEGIATASGIETLNTVLAAIPVRTPVSSLIQTPVNVNGSTGRENWDFDKWQSEAPRDLEAMAEKEPEKFKELFNAKYKK
ncbi:ATP-dependent Clp protease proteolytic subunit [Flavobacterium sp. B183]|uniref:Clp protease ClpP n=1 Tax=Flavobacterium sp. B183 TaxID=907046 RepID=UPI00201F2156|nr:ATP-dependent Clp protease proteolytic subunit [Flavobacterium sp. B183]URC13951.1 ATP-dependent Clp protease proteolytic subunit [Flavobacterium sp. B183]URC14029.1 ATP-dependent Clp protease proteolytic subunit [Flavobacterium sp. B183]